LQRGFTLVELIIAVSISALLAVYAQSALMKQAEESLATASGTYLSTLANATQQLVLVRWNDYSQGLAVAGYANPLEPTIAELTAGAYLNAGFPPSMPTRQTATVSVVTSNCPGATCRLDIQACTTGPVNLGGGPARLDLASTMVSAQNGNGVQTLNLPVGGYRLIGPKMNIPSPFGTVEGIVCGTSMVDTTLYNTFVKINDTRDPNLQGNLTVAGSTNLNGPTTISNTLNVTGAITGTTANLGATNCVNMEGVTGRAGFGCVQGADLPAGYTGGVRSPDVVANRNVLTSDSPATFTGANTNYAVMTANNGAGVAEIRTSGRAMADRVTFSGQYTRGAACVASDEGSIARMLGGTGLLVCQGGLWVGLSSTDSIGDACTVEGQMSKANSGVSLLCVNGQFRSMDTIVRFGVVGGACPAIGVTALDTGNNNQLMVCRQNLTGGALRYMRIQDVTTQLTFVTAVEVAEGSIVGKPNCLDSGGQVATPIIQMIPKVFNSPDGGYAVYAVDNGANWTTRMRIGSGGAMPGNAVAIAQTYCYFN
jgi:hypothetical protein